MTTVQSWRLVVAVALVVLAIGAHLHGESGYPFAAAALAALAEPEERPRV